MNSPCGCCEGVERVTPIAIANRPGLPALAYRVGTHATFLETMLARLPTMHVDGLRPLRRLTARTADDPAIALLDAWAIVADVLTFYQERIANEGYLRTATERRSIHELARLVGYRLRPGLASSVYLAYTLEPGGEVEIPAGSRAQSLPGPGELPQPFETSEPLRARAEWNNLQVRLTRPQNIEKIDDSINTDVVYFEGTATNLKPNDALLFVFGTGNGQQVLRFVEKVEPNAAANRTRVTLQGGSNQQREIVTDLNRLIRLLAARPSRPLASSLRLERSLEGGLSPGGGGHLRLLGGFDSALGEKLSAALGGARFSAQGALQSCEAFRVKASLFGHNAPVQPRFRKKDDELTLYTLDKEPTLTELWKEFRPSENRHTVLLDGVYEQILPRSWVAISLPEVACSPLTAQIVIRQVERAEAITVGGAGFSVRVTCLHLCTSWLDEKSLKWLPTEDPASTPLLRGGSVFAQSDLLLLAEEPIDIPIGGCTHDERATPAEIELNRVNDGLDTGRWLIVSGERDIQGTPGVRDSERVMVAGVEHRRQSPSDSVHTFVHLSPPLSYCYKRDTVTIYGNVVKATHGETREEILGSGDGGKARQEFALRQSPLTHLPAPTPVGAASALTVRVNGIEWNETDSAVGLGCTDRKFITRTDDQNQTAVVFGDGERGARLPTGVENVKAVYRTGIGRAGNVKQGQISLLATRPLGVKGVINPQRASGGADPDSRDQARRNVPLRVMALDRLVAVQDYADFARSFAGIGKASAARLTDGQRQLVHVTIAGSDDIRIDESSDLFRHLLRALHEHGDPHHLIQLAVRELSLLVISANVRVLPEYEWEAVAPRLRSAMLDAFGFERRELGQDVFLSEVISTMQTVEGVDYADVDTLAAVDEEKVKALLAGSGPLDLGSPANGRLHIELARLSDKAPGVIRPARVAFLPPSVPDTLILNLAN